MTYAELQSLTLTHFSKQLDALKLPVDQSVIDETVVTLDEITLKLEVAIRTGKTISPDDANVNKWDVSGEIGDVTTDYLFEMTQEMAKYIATCIKEDYNKKKTKKKLYGVNWNECTAIKQEDLPDLDYKSPTTTVGE